MKESHHLIIGLLLLLVLFGCESGIQYGESTHVKSSLADQVDHYINAHASNRKFNGNILIAQGDSILYEKSFGLANREFSVPISSSTKFLIGSVTKPFTAYGILLLESQGRLSLEDKLSKYFPDFPNADKISIKHLLTHRSGITDYHAFDNWKEDSKLDRDPRFTLTGILEKPSIFEPGERFSYSNSGYIFLGLIIEQVSGEKFDVFIQKEILDPIGLSNTGIASNTQIVSHLAEGYTSNPREILKTEYINYNQPFSSGNMYSTAEDLWKFTRAVMTSELLPAGKIKEIFTIADFYGYGWGIRNYDGKLAYGHHGAMNGFVASITYIPEGEYFICFLTNDDNTPRFTISDDIVSIVDGKEILPPEPYDLTPLSDEMKRTVSGAYLVKPGDTLKVYEVDDRLYMRETGQSAHEMFPISQYEYCFTILEMNVLFSEPIEGLSDTLKFIGKSNVKARRIKIP